MSTELRQQEPETVPANECAQQVDAVRGWNLMLSAWPTEGSRGR